MYNELLNYSAEDVLTLLNSLLCITAWQRKLNNTSRVSEIPIACHTGIAMCAVSKRCLRGEHMRVILLRQ